MQPGSRKKRGPHYVARDVLTPLELQVQCLQHLAVRFKSCSTAPATMYRDLAINDLMSQNEQSDETALSPVYTYI